MRVYTSQCAMKICAPIWAIEYDIALEYFSLPFSKRDRERERKWLELQIHKEWCGSGVYGGSGETVETLIAKAAAAISKDNAQCDWKHLKENSEILDFANDELSHYVSMLSLYRQFFSMESKEDMLSWGCSGEAIKLSEMRYSFRGDPLGLVAVRLSEGGGLGLFYGIRDSFANFDNLEEFDLVLLDVVNRILKDEEGHLTSNFIFADQILSDDPSWEVVVEILKKISIQKVREREEQFGVERREVMNYSKGRICHPYMERHCNNLLTRLALEGK
ncbi:hypothetical protein [Burkholderia pyrrocinia]|uniref:hypothetical protein n=1 Tax=Burkholderia pyrrocinia TaxID=60550 RepID=UPI002AB0A121|nr:hypothetical protein [Burkholderia pyrrocinia]